MNTWDVVHSDNLRVLRMLPDESVDAIVTDPPAGIGFMGKVWDHHKGGRAQWIAWMTTVMQECLRVLKPGGHALVWALPRTSHWTATAVEDAGFEIRDRVSHFFGSGFPKSMNVSKAIDKQLGATPIDLGRQKIHGDGKPQHFTTEVAKLASAGASQTGATVHANATAPATRQAAQWEGYGTALKPACEDWWLCRKPVNGTVAACVLARSTGALNIDACRIGENPGYVYNANKNGTTFHGEHSARQVQTSAKRGADVVQSTKGRYPAHLVFDEVAAQLLDEQSGVLTSGAHTPVVRANRDGNTYGRMTRIDTYTNAASKGGASRFFYCAKASKKDKGHDNKHPTVKNTALMRWLVKLVTPPGGLVVDPFCGSGSTGVAALREGMRFLGIEQDASHAAYSFKRLYAEAPHAYVDGIATTRRRR